MGLFSGIFGTPQTMQNTSVTKRTVLSSGKDTVSLAKGQVVKGEVTDLRSNEVTVRLEDGKTLHAKLSSAIELSIGQKAEFFVQEADDVLITLKLLSDGDTSFTESAIDTALEAAGLPKSAGAVTIVRSLLNAGLPVGKEMIQKMMQYSAANKDVALSTLTALIKNNLPVTKENASQLQAYRNFEHRLVGQASTLASALTDAFRFNETTPEFTRDLFTTLFRDDTPHSPENPLSASIPSGNRPADASTGQSTVTFSKQADGLLLQAEPLDSGLTEAIAANAAFSGADLSSAEAPPVQTVQAPLKNILTEKDYRQLGTSLATLSTDSAEFQLLNQDYTSGALTAKQLFSILSKHAASGFPKEISALLKDSPVISSLFEKALLERFVLTPEDLTKEDAVQNYYERTLKTLSSLTDLASSGESSALKTVADTGRKMQDNIRFMNTLNQLFPYVQLPLKLTEQLTHGELYVYAKKKDLSAETKEVSVLLHLDMDALGPTDVHLTLLQPNVTARFYLTDASAQELVTGELPSLTASLQKKGYFLTAQVMQRKKEPDIVNDFMNNGESVSMKRFRFDIRA